MQKHLYILQFWETEKPTNTSLFMLLQISNPVDTILYLFALVQILNISHFGYIYGSTFASFMVVLGLLHEVRFISLSMQKGAYYGI